MQSLHSAPEYAKSHLLGLIEDRSTWFAAVPRDMLLAVLLPMLRPIPRVHRKSSNSLALYYCGMYFYPMGLYPDFRTSGPLIAIDWRNGVVTFTVEDKFRSYSYRLEAGDAFVHLSTDWDGGRAIRTVRNIYTGESIAHA